MIQFQFQLDGEHSNSSKWDYGNGYIKGDFQIYVEGDIFFDEPYMNIVELAMQLGKWLVSVRHGVMRDFVYESLDHHGAGLHFSMQQDRIRLSSTWQNNERQELLSLKDVINAITRYLVSLNVKLHEINYFEKLDRFLHNDLSENAKALMLFEQNEYNSAFALIKRLAEEQHDVQSLNNLAWMYLQEEEDLQTAKRLLLEVLHLNPQSHFPYNMLGEIELVEGDLQLAETYLTKSLQLKRSEEAVHNLGIIYFRQDRFEEAANCFAQIKSEESWLYEVIALVKAGQDPTAKALLAGWTPEMENDVSATEMADVYIELKEFALAKKWFEFGLTEGYLTPYLISRYTYALIQLKEEVRCQQIIEEQLVLKKAEIQEAHQETCDEDWTELDKQERLAELQTELELLATLFEQLSQGFVPPLDYVLYPTTSCYLFGCTQHGHAEYEQ